MDSTQAMLRSATTRELARSGMDGRTLSGQVAQERMSRVSRGIYLETDPDAASAVGLGKMEREHLGRAVACARALPGSYLVAESACLAYGLPIWQVPSRVQLSRHPRLQSVRPEVDARRAWWPETEYLERWDVNAQPPGAAALEAAARRGTLAGLIPADAAAHRGHVWDAEALLGAWGARAGVARVRLLFDVVDGRRESPLETWTAWEAHTVGITLVPQVVIRDEHGGWVATVDFIVAGTNVVVEADGIGKYTGHRAFKDERVRHNQIEELGWIVVRVTWDDLRSGRFLPRLRAAVARASRVRTA